MTIGQHDIFLTDNIRIDDFRSVCCSLFRICPVSVFLDTQLIIVLFSGSVVECDSVPDAVIHIISYFNFSQKGIYLYNFFDRLGYFYFSPGVILPVFRSCFQAYQITGEKLGFHAAVFCRVIITGGDQFGFSNFFLLSVDIDRDGSIAH